jgi:dihydrofolate reductase
MRKLIAGLKISADGKSSGASGIADWVDAWSEDYGLSSQIDACLLGGGMYPGYEQYWTAIQDGSGAPLPMTGKLPTPGEVDWGRFAARTTHYVLSNTLASAAWPNTKFIRNTDDVAALKREPGKDIYLMGGASTTTSLINAGLVDELRLIVYPLVSGEGQGLFESVQGRHPLELKEVRRLESGRFLVTYTLI